MELSHHLNKGLLKVVKLFGIILLLLISSSNYADTKIDSIKSNISKSINDEEKILLLLDLASSYVDVNTDSAKYYVNLAQINLLSNPGIYTSAYYYHVKGVIYNKSFKNDSAILFLKTSYSLYNEIDSIKDIARVNNLIATCFNDLIIYDSAIYYYNLSFARLDSIKHSSLYAANLNNIANVYDNLGDKKKALDYYIRALTIFKELNQEVNVAITTNNIGVINLDIGNYYNSIKYLDEAAELNLKNGNNFNLCLNYNSLGSAYKELAQFDKALQYTILAMEIAVKSNFEYLEAQSSHNLGTIYKDNKEYDMAISHLQKSLDMCNQLDITKGEIYNLINLGEAYTNQKKFEISEEHLLAGLELCRQTDFSVHYEEVYDALMKNYQAWGKYREAFNYYQKYVSIRDSLTNVLREKELNEIQTKYETEQKEIENQKLKSQNELQEMTIFRQRLLVIVTVFVALVAIALLVMLFTVRKKRKERIALLQAKNKLIREKSEQLNRTIQTKDQLFSIIAHDLRSPFGSLMGFSALLTEEAEANNFDNTLLYAQQLNSATASTFELLDNLLNWSRSQQDNLKPSIAKIDLNTTVNEIIRALQEKVDEKQIKLLNLVIEETIISTDKNMIMVVIRNLISNAIKFTPKKGQINVGAKKDGGNTVISIQDSGVGIEPDIQKKLFSGTPGYTTRGTEKEQGSGLGLMLVKDFAERLGGTVWVKSQPGKGSTFSFSIPQNQTNK